VGVVSLILGQGLFFGNARVLEYGIAVGRHSICLFSSMKSRP